MTVKEVCEAQAGMQRPSDSLFFLGSENGFGGNRNVGATPGRPFCNGYCLSTGPFANLQVLYVSPDYRPHCLSRGLESGTRLARLGESLKPEKMKGFFLSDFEAFNLGLEDGPHLTIPKIIQGDFTLFTAPCGA